MNDHDDHLDPATRPELAPLLDALSALESPTDPVTRAEHVSRAARTAAASESSTTPTWAGVLSWRAAAAAVVALVAAVVGLGADDRLPEPAQRFVSSVADAAGIEIPDGSERTGTTDDADHDHGRERPEVDDSRPTTDGQNDDEADGRSTNRKTAEPATPADPGEPGEPATPAIPATPADPDPPSAPNSTVPDRGRPDDPGRSSDAGNDKAKAKDKDKDKGTGDEDDQGGD